jgi:hypothetical protein
MGWSNANPWNVQDVEYLKSCHGKVTIDDAVTFLNRDKLQVYTKMRILGLQFKTNDPPYGMIWRTSLVPGVLASETGLLWSEKKQQLIVPSVNGAGDHFILVDRQPVNVSKIVYEAFYGKITDNRQVFRKDKDPANSDIGNLICITRAEARTRGMWGIQHPIAVYKNGKRIAVYVSAVAAAKAFGVTNQTIASRAEGKVPKWTNKRSARMEGYEFKYLNTKKQSANRQDVLARKKRIINDQP